MKKLIKYMIIVVFCAAEAVYGQTPPVSVEVNGVTYFQHGFNEDGGPFNNANTTATPPSPEYTGWQTREIRDSVTITSKVKYFVLPNAGLNPGYSITDPLANVRSTFNWSLGSTPLGSFSGTSPLIEITWHTLGTDILTVEEVPQDPTCEIIPTSIPIVVIPKPTIEFVANSTGQPYLSVFCFSIEQDVEPLPWDFDLKIETQSSQIDISYTVTVNGVNAPDLAGNNKRIVDGKLPFTFPNLGEYVITITSITDRVARKSGVEGNVADLSAGGQFTFRVFREIQTSPIYRVPNNF